MLTIGQHQDVTFKVNVMGTSAEPKVRLVLGTTPELSFPAVKQGDLWCSPVAVPETVEPGTTTLRVEVIINNRYFSPLTKQIELLAPSIEKSEDQLEPAEIPYIEPEVAEQTVEQTAPVEEVTSVAPVEEVTSVEEVVQPEEVTEEPAVVEVQPEEIKVVKPSLLKSFKEDVAAPAPKKEPVKKVYAPVITPLPKVVEAVEKKPVKINLAEVTKIAEAKPVKAKQNAKAKVPEQVLEIKHEVPIKLTKGTIIYE